MATSYNQVKIMKSRLLSASKLLADSRSTSGEMIEELLNEIDGCSAAIREYYDIVNK